MDAASLLLLGRRLLEAPAAEYVGSAATELRRLLASDEIYWLRTDFEAGAYVVWRAGLEGRDTVAEAGMGAMLEHPAIRSYRRAPDDLTPRVLADVPPPLDSAGKAALRLSQELMGTEQLSMVVEMRGTMSGNGWVLTREGRGYDAAELDTARWLLPLLAVFDRLHGTSVSSGIQTAPASTACRPAAWDQLTRREHEVVDLLSSGMTHRAIGRVLGISARTVSKHLENAYRKLGHHDRLLVALDSVPLAIPSPRMDET